MLQNKNVDLKMEASRSKYFPFLSAPKPPVHTSNLGLKRIATTLIKVAMSHSTWKMDRL